MLNSSIRDLMQSIIQMPLAIYFAWGDTKARYRRSTLGPFWMVISTAIGVVGLGAIWSILLKQQKETFIPALTVGLVTWQFISGTISEGASAFVRYAPVIKNIETHFFIFPLQLLLRHIINFAHNFIVVLVVIAAFPPNFGWEQLLLIPGLLLTFLNLFWMVSLLALIGTRFRDMELIVSSSMPLLFFLSPVLYKPGHLGIAENIAWINPFSHLITLIRSPIQGEIPPNFVYATTITMLVFGWLLTLKLFSSRSKKIPLWL